MNLWRRSAIAVAVTVLLAAVVEIAGPKAVHAVTSLLVTVTNTYTNPVMNRDVDNLDRGTFQTGVAGYYSDGLSPLRFRKVAYTVPAGNRLIVDYVSGVSYLSANTDVNFFVIGVAHDPNNPTLLDSSHYLAPTFKAACGFCPPGGQAEAVANGPVRLIVYAGEALVLGADRNDGNQDFPVGVQVTAHLIQFP